MSTNVFVTFKDAEMVPKLVVVIDEPSARYESDIFSFTPGNTRLTVVVKPLLDVSKGYVVHPKRVRGWQATLSHRPKRQTDTDSCLLKLEVSRRLNILHSSIPVLSSDGGFSKLCKL